MWKKVTLLTLSFQNCYFSNISHRSHNEFTHRFKINLFLDICHSSAQKRFYLPYPIQSPFQIDSCWSTGSKSAVSINHIIFIFLSYSHPICCSDTNSRCPSHYHVFNGFCYLPRNAFDHWNNCFFNQHYLKIGFAKNVLNIRWKFSLVQ